MKFFDIYFRKITNCSVTFLRKLFLKNEAVYEVIFNLGLGLIEVFFHLPIKHFQPPDLI